ncbi:putative alanine racemase [Pillotina sp. SPG140]|jgi:alanine racemase
MTLINIDKTKCMQATKALIYEDRFRANIAAVKQSIGPKRLICASVKADAYGHGALRIAQIAEAAGIQYLAVATVFEGAVLRSQGITAPILLFSIPTAEEWADIVQYKLIPFIADRESALLAHKAAEQANVRLNVHIKIDSGMGRIGIRPQEAAPFAQFIHSLAFLNYSGTATHFSVSDSTDPDDSAYTDKQMACFCTAVESIRHAGINPGIIHAANSGAVVFHKNALLDMVRVGIILYGYSPDQTILPVQPVMELVSRISFIKKVYAGQSISYGRTWVAPHDTVIGTIPIGYADGFPRRLSNNYSVLIKNRLYPIVGRICMDQSMIDLGPDTAVPCGETVTIFGAKPAYSAADIAAALGTISYEILCAINTRVPRIFV